MTREYEFILLSTLIRIADALDRAHPIQAPKKPQRLPDDSFFVASDAKRRAAELEERKNQPRF